MNLTGAQAVALVRELCELEAASDFASDRSGAEESGIVICPPFTALDPVNAVLSSPKRQYKTRIALGAQDCSPYPNGAYTGDVSATMLGSLGVSYVIVGHSERRGEHNEAPEQVRAKADTVMKADMIPVICVGEGRAERYNGTHIGTVTAQMFGSLPESPSLKKNLGGHSSPSFVIAYEPVWAIGTGLAASQEDVAEMHAHLRESLNKAFPEGAAIPLLYGGSVKPSNACDLLSIPNVDGLLVGGASLTANSFWTIAGCEGTR